MRIQPTSQSNETLGYIGHGQLESSPLSMSVLHVVGHELDHVAEFRNEAIRDNAEIRSIEMKIDYEYRDGKLVAVSGKTTATTQKKPEKNHSNTSEIENENENEIKIKKEIDFKKSDKEKIQNEERNLLFRLEHIKSEIASLEENGYYTDPLSKDIQGRKEEQRKEELKEKERKIEVELENFRIQTRIEKSQEFFKEIQDDVQNQSLLFAKIQFEPTSGSNLDITV